MIERTEEYKGYTIHVLRDECAQEFDPRAECENTGTMVCFHSRYSLGDKHDYNSKDYSGWGEILAAVEKDNGPLVVLPLFLYDHSGLSISSGSEQFRAVDGVGWDWGQVGFIYVPIAAIRKQWGWKKLTQRRREEVCSLLRAEVSEYDKYLRGEVYGFEVTDSEGNHVDSCWGFLGTPEESGLLEQAREAADYAAERRDSSRVKAVLTITFLYRKDESEEAISRSLNREANRLATKVLSFSQGKGAQAEEWECNVALSRECV